MIYNFVSSCSVVSKERRI